MNDSILYQPTILELKVQLLVGFMLIILMTILKWLYLRKHRWFKAIQSKLTSTEYRRKHLDDLTVCFLTIVAMLIAGFFNALPQGLVIILLTAALHVEDNMMKAFRFMARYPIVPPIVVMPMLFIGVSYPSLLSVVFVIEVVEMATLILGKNYLSMSFTSPKPYKIMSLPSFRNIFAILTVLAALAFVFFGCNKILMIIIAAVVGLLIALALVRGGSNNDKDNV